jgi:hypothetical protein
MAVSKASAVTLSPEAAEAALFPADVTIVSADVLAAYMHHTSRFGRASYWQSLATLHARSLASSPVLAALCRAPEALEDCAAAAASLAHPQTPAESIADAQRRESVSAITRFKRAIASQLAARDGHELQIAAQVVLDAFAAEDAAAAAAVEAQREFDRQRAIAEAAERERQAAERLGRRTRAHQIIERASKLSDEQERIERDIRAQLSDVLIERLDGSDAIRTREGRVFEAANVIAHARARQWSLEQLRAYHDAIDFMEAQS